MTGYQRIINGMDPVALAKIKPGFWAKNFGVSAAVISECVDARVRELADIELLRARPEVPE